MRFDEHDGGESGTVAQRCPAEDLGQNLAGSRFASFFVEEMVGRGGMGVVYRARERFGRNRVALKVLPVLTRADREPVRRFLAEARALTRLSHPAIPRIRAFGREHQLYYLATDYVAGRTVTELLDAGRPFTPRRALEIARAAAAALRVAHEHGILHRDVKADNIMIDEQGQVKVLDFGIAQDLGTRRITRSECYLGTPEYCSPEQLCSLPMDARTDVYSLGVVLHEMLTGVMPFGGASTVRLYHDKRRDRRPALAHLLPGSPRVLVRLVKRFLAPSPERRFASMADAVRAIEETIPKLGAFGWGRRCVRRFARRRPSSWRRPRLLPEPIASLFF
ncbi:MAG: serine/threonine protein kinase [Planctomycetes bacterium]|nr:serine/threonine protein kinase [Planctomycetota bacterium]